ncbi:hypothetical protein DVH05_022619 [Phytophthora capsici]|nr:hypothetical protein DVH05_022619 [Phytophthora capsici]
MDPRSSPIASGNGLMYNICDVLNLPVSMDLLDDEDFESTMMMLDNEGATSSPTSTFRREDRDNLELGLTGLSDVFNTESPLATNSQSAGNSGLTVCVSSCFSPEVKARIGGKTPNGSDVYIKQESDMPDFSPVMDSFLRESWDDIVENGSRSTRPSFISASSCDSPFTISTTPGRVNPLPFNFQLPIPSPLGVQPLAKRISFVAPPIPFPPMALRTVSNTSTSSTVSSVSSTKSRGTRRAKQCIAEGCTRRAQSNNRCKTHGGGARCQVEGCNKSSQGGGLCRAHGGGKKCRVPGCSKGTQRLGLCYLHGGIRRCITEGCKKKDRGNGYCISHGGGRRCEAENCSRSVRKGNHCQMHQVLAEETPFRISRYQGLGTS